MTRIGRIQETLDAKTRRWWFFVGAILLQFLLPPFASKGFDIEKWGDIIGYTLSHALLMSWKPVFPPFQILAIAAVLLLVTLKNKAHRAFALHAGASYALIAILQSVAIAPTYGVSIVTINVVMFLAVAAVWFWEAAAGRNDFSRQDRSAWRYLLIPPAFLAFWLPISWTTGMPDFNPLYLVTSGSSLMFCLITPVHMAVLIFFYPRVNTLTLRVHGIVGVIIGLYNVIPKLVLLAYSTWWDGMLHLPLLVLSAIGLALSMRRVD